MRKGLFEQTFRTATRPNNGNIAYNPLPYQSDLALEGETMPALLDVPTGLGKTAGAVLAWIWRRRFDPRPNVRARTPRRLVYCLPMRVLVEQTHAAATEWLTNLNLLANQQQSEDKWDKTDGDFGEHPIAVHLLLGGAPKSDWALWPDRDAILIGTQDMLLSRALNRGYSAGRARWPLEFGFLNNDCLWVFDEIQIMDTGLATSLQFDAWRNSLSLRSSRADFPSPTRNHTAKPCQSLWMSATMAHHWLQSAVDWSPQAATEWNNRRQLTERDREDPHVLALFEVKKELAQAELKLEKPKTKDGKATDAEQKRLEYLKSLEGWLRKPQNRAPAGLTLIILNTVDRATQLFELLSGQPAIGVPIRLIHSRFRPVEREQWRDFLARRDDAPRILISTQVVEAGVDLSAGVLYSELAPWASLVQRFGRCARYPGESGRIFWIDLDLGKDNQPVDHWATPYARADLVVARQKLKTLKDVGLATLMSVKQEIDADTAHAKSIFPYYPRFVPREKDLFDLFDTTPDLTGADVDVSRFIRDGEELDIQVFWRELAGQAPGKKDQPGRSELCSVPCYRFQEQLPVLRNAGRIWRRNYRKGWENVDPRDRDRIYPGQIYLLEKSCGGYSAEIGWSGKPSHTNFELPTIEPPGKDLLQDEEEDSEDLSQIQKWLNVFAHTRDVCEKLNNILRDSGLSEPYPKILRLAGRWHDRGKAHDCFQSKLKPEKLSDDAIQKHLGGEPAAKAPKEVWLQNGSRPGFRHELASALAIMETLHSSSPEHAAFAWPSGLNKSHFPGFAEDSPAPSSAGDPLAEELAKLSPDELDLLIYLVAAHHGKVRMSIRSSPDDDSCPNGKRQARGVRDGDDLRPCQLPSAELATALVARKIVLTLDPMELGLSPRYGASWRERMQFLLERLGPFHLAYLEGLLRAADCRASDDEDSMVAPAAGG
jgi:CRISPR-associated endonuclease/helicase Cas3